MPRGRLEARAFPPGSCGALREPERGGGNEAAGTSGTCGSWLSGLMSKGEGWPGGGALMVAAGARSYRQQPGDCAASGRE
jgi:hypothetical protein